MMLGISDRNRRRAILRAVRELRLTTPQPGTATIEPAPPPAKPARKRPLRALVARLYAQARTHKAERIAQACAKYAPRQEKQKHGKVPLQAFIERLHTAP